MFPQYLLHISKIWIHWRWLQFWEPVKDWINILAWIAYISHQRSHWSFLQVTVLTFSLPFHLYWRSVIDGSSEHCFPTNYLSYLRILSTIINISNLHKPRKKTLKYLPSFQLCLISHSLTPLPPQIFSLTAAKWPKSILCPVHFVLNHNNLSRFLSNKALKM